MVDFNKSIVRIHFVIKSFKFQNTYDLHAISPICNYEIDFVAFAALDLLALPFDLFLSPTVQDLWLHTHGIRVVFLMNRGRGRNKKFG